MSSDDFFGCSHISVAEAGCQSRPVMDCFLIWTFFSLSWQLSVNLRHIRVFEMDVEDEDDEGAESQNASADQDGLETSMTSQGLGDDGVEAKDGAGERGEVIQKAEEHLESEEALDVSWDRHTGTPQIWDFAPHSSPKSKSLARGKSGELSWVTGHFWSWSASKETGGN